MTVDEARNHELHDVEWTAIFQLRSSSDFCTILHRQVRLQLGFHPSSAPCLWWVILELWEQRREMQDIDSLLKSERLWLKVGCNVSQALRCRETHTYTKRHAHGHPRVSPFASLSMFMLPLDSTNWSAWLCVYCNSATLHALPCLLTWSLIPCSQENIRSMTCEGPHLCHGQSGLWNSSSSSSSSSSSPSPSSSPSQ